MSEKRTYDYAPFGGVPGLDPGAAAAELARIRSDNGGALTATAVIEASVADDAPLHPAFTWDDTEAGHCFRLIQARTLIRAVRITAEGHPPQRIYVHVTSDDREGTYEPMALVVKQPDRFLLAVIELQRRLTAAQESLDELRSAGKAGGDRNQMTLIGLAAEAFATARAAVQALH